MLRQNAVQARKSETRLELESFLALPPFFVFSPLRTAIRYWRTVVTLFSATDGPFAFARTLSHVQLSSFGILAHLPVTPLLEAFRKHPRWPPPATLSGFVVFVAVGIPWKRSVT